MTDGQYPDDFVAGLEWIWGEGFLSPGGVGEVRELLKGIDLKGKRILDIGCGLGAIDVLMVGEFGAGSVIGIDVESALLERAHETARKAGLQDRLEFKLVAPGPLPFSADEFDIVFSKDSIIHIPDKGILYADVFRVLVAGGVFVASDWLYGGEPNISDVMKSWLEIVHLDFALLSPKACADLLKETGFEEVRIRDRNAWYRGEVLREIASVDGERKGRLAAKIGHEKAAHRLASSQAKLEVVKSGELCPCHLFGMKPR